MAYASHHMRRQEMTVVDSMVGRSFLSTACSRDSHAPHTMHGLKRRVVLGGLIRVKGWGKRNVGQDKA